MESSLHTALKKAVERHHAKGGRCWFEITMEPWGGKGCLRVDVFYTRNRRDYYVECETRPNIKRLLEKGRRRNENPRRTVYDLVVPESEYIRRDWRQLRGYFDRVHAYSVDEERFIECLDLRTLGSLQDFVLDIIIPFYKSPEFQVLCRFFWRRKNYVEAHASNLAECLRCCRGRGRSLYFCAGETCRVYKLFQQDKVPPELF